jgi:ABC-type lipoprotein export system ATPase subunit
MISLRGVEKSFPHGPTRTYVLRRIDLDIRPGEFVSIMGPSGAGKSTLLHILGMHDQSWTGEYYFDDWIERNALRCATRTSDLFSRAITCLTIRRFSRISNCHFPIAT